MSKKIDAPAETATLANNLKSMMEKRGLNSPARLGMKAQLDTDTIRLILRGRSKHPRPETIRKLARALRCEVEDLAPNAGGGNQIRLQVRHGHRENLMREIQQSVKRAAAEYGAALDEATERNLVRSILNSEIEQQRKSTCHKFDMDDYRKIVETVTDEVRIAWQKWQAELGPDGLVFDREWQPAKDPTNL